MERLLTLNTGTCVPPIFFNSDLFNNVQLVSPTWAVKRRLQLTFKTNNVDLSVKKYCGSYQLSNTKCWTIPSLIWQQEKGCAQDH